MAIKKDRGLSSKGFSGQMTIEFVIAFPAALIIGLIAVNAVLFFSECAAFDRSFRSLVCTYAASPAYEQGTDRSCALILESLQSEFSADHIEVEVNSRGVSGELVVFEGTLKFSPTLLEKVVYQVRLVFRFLRYLIVNRLRWMCIRRVFCYERFSWAQSAEQITQRITESYSIRRLLS